MATWRARSLLFVLLLASSSASSPASTRPRPVRVQAGGGLGRARSAARASARPPEEGSDRPSVRHLDVPARRHGGRLPADGLFHGQAAGFDREHVLVVRDAVLLGQRVPAFKEELLRNPDVLSATLTRRSGRRPLQRELLDARREGARTTSSWRRWPATRISWRRSSSSWPRAGSSRPPIPRRPGRRHQRGTAAGWAGPTPSGRPSGSATRSSASSGPQGLPFLFPPRQDPADGLRLHGRIPFAGREPFASASGRATFAGSWPGFGRPGTRSPASPLELFLPGRGLRRLYSSKRGP